MHATRIEPHEERLLVPVRAIDEIQRGLEEFFVDGLHSFLGERPRILAPLLAPRAKSGIVTWRVSRSRDALHDAARTELRPERGVLRIVSVLRLILGVQVVEIAEEFVEAVNGRQKLIAIAEMVLAELSRRVTLRLEQVGERWILRRQTLLCRRQTHLQEASAQWALASDERSSTGGAGLLAVVVREDGALAGNAVNVGRPIAHHAAVIGADVPVSDVIAHDDEDVGFLLLGERGCNHQIQ